MKPSHPSALGYVLPLLPAVLLGVMAATGSGKALLKAANRSGAGGSAIVADSATVGLPFGGYRVEVHEDVLLHDGKRGKDIPVTVLLPRASGRFPVIIFSHGAGGDGNQNRPLTSYWASHGYVVLCPTHMDSLAWQRRQTEAGIIPTEDPSSPGLSLDGDAGEFGSSADQEALRNPRIWLERAEDISYVMDSLDELGRRIPSLTGKMDPARVGIGGTSWLGATTAQIVVGAPLGGRVIGSPTYYDPRARAVLLLTNSGGGYLGLPRSSCASIAKPLLMVTGSCRRSKYAAAAAADDAAWMRTTSGRPFGGVGQYRIRLAGSHPLSFGGDYESLVRNEQATGKGFFPYVENTTLAFWDASLKQDTDARSLLASAGEPEYASKFGVSAALVHR